MPADHSLTFNIMYVTTFLCTGVRAGYHIAKVIVNLEHGAPDAPDAVDCHVAVEAAQSALKHNVAPRCYIHVHPNH